MAASAAPHTTPRRGDGGPRVADVAVVIPCFRQAQFLPSALESVWGQTLVPAEVVVVDDGSPDDVASVVARFPGTKLVRQPNRGLAAARNAGLHATRSPFVAFLDADDVLYREALAAGVEALARHPECAFAAGGYRVRDSAGRVLDVRAPDGRATRYADMLRGNHIAMHGAVLYRREPLVDAGAFRESLPTCEDWDVYLRLLRRWPAASHEAIVAEYRRHSDNMSLDRVRMLDGALAVLRAHRPHVRHDAALRASYDHGRQHARDLFGEPLMAAVCGGERPPGGWRRAARDLGALVRLDPVYYVPRFVRFALGRAARAIGGARARAR